GRRGHVFGDQAPRTGGRGRSSIEEQTMKKTAAALSKLGIAPEDASLPASAKRFPDGAQYRIEIPSVETPDALAAVLEDADKLKITIHRASQGSGIMMLTDVELSRMLRIAKDAKIELSL